MFQNLERLNISNNKYADDDLFNLIGVYCKNLRYFENNSVVIISVF